EEHTRNMRPCFHKEVVARHHGLQKRSCRVATPMPPQRQLIRAKAGIVCPIEVFGRCKAGLRSCIQPGLAIRMVVSQVRHSKLATAAMIFALASLITLRAIEIRQDIAIAPAMRPRLLPTIEISMLAADGQQAINRAGSSQPTASRPDDFAIGRFGLGGGGKLPRKARVINRTE